MALATRGLARQEELTTPPFLVQYLLLLRSYWGKFGPKYFQNIAQTTGNTEEILPIPTEAKAIFKVKLRKTQCDDEDIKYSAMQFICFIIWDGSPWPVTFNVVTSKVSLYSSLKKFKIVFIQSFHKIDKISNSGTSGFLYDNKIIHKLFISWKTSPAVKYQEVLELYTGDSLGGGGGSTFMYSCIIHVWWPFCPKTKCQKIWQKTPTDSGGHNSVNSWMILSFLRDKIAKFS